MLKPCTKSNLGSETIREILRIRKYFEISTVNFIIIRKFHVGNCLELILYDLGAPV